MAAFTSRFWSTTPQGKVNGAANTSTSLARLLRSAMSPRYDVVLSAESGFELNTFKKVLDIELERVQTELS